MLIPTIVLAEALNIAAKERVVFDFQQLYQLVRDEPEFEIAEFGVEIFDETLRVSAVPEIHDRVIVATARFYGADLLTKDGIPRRSHGWCGRPLLRASPRLRGRRCHTPM